jgi:hypothetical protein
MTLLDVAECSPEEARALTEQIRSATDALWQLLAEAHERRAWSALKYSSFAAYVSGEFPGMSRQRAYQLIDQATVIAALNEVSTMVDTISERQARELTPLKSDPVKVRAAHKAGQQIAEAEGRKATAADMREAVAIVENATATLDNDEADEAEVIETVAQAVADNIESKRLPVSKPDLGGGISHPARYTDALIPVFAEIIAGEHDGTDTITVLDPFAGTGKIHQLRDHLEHVRTVGIELEPEWAALHDDTHVGDATDLPFPAETIEVVCTSPTYGNRLADKHNASDPHLRRSYTHDLGRPLTDNNSGGLQWGEAYRAFHAIAWAEALRVLRVGGLLIVNIKDHVRDGQVQLVSMWHTACITTLGAVYRPDLSRAVTTPSMRAGTNSDLRVAHEYVVAFTKDDGR